MITSKMTEIELNDGEKINLTLNFSKLLEVRNKRKEVYKRYNEIVMDGVKDSFDSADVLYTAYLCALDNPEKGMSREAFLEKLPPYPAYINNIMFELMQPKKKTDSEELSQKRPENQNEE